MLGDDDHAETFLIKRQRNAVNDFAPIERILCLRTDIGHQYQNRLLVAVPAGGLGGTLHILHIGVFLCEVAKLRSGLDDPLSCRFVDAALARQGLGDDEFGYTEMVGDFLHSNLFSHRITSKKCNLIRPRLLRLWRGRLAFARFLPYRIELIKRLL
ncbi:hypothetical protein D3C73_934540 [compost metagenome]